MPSPVPAPPRPLSVQYAFPCLASRAPAFGGRQERGEAGASAFHPDLEMTAMKTTEPIEVAAEVEIREGRAIHVSVVAERRLIALPVHEDGRARLVGRATAQPAPVPRL